MLLNTDIISTIIQFILIVIALSVHEFAHAYAADKLGDPTPRLQGRLTLNPLSHLDPVGTLLILLIGFGWGKPVQFDPYNLKNPQIDTTKIAFAGPLSNILLAIITAIVIHLFSINNSLEVILHSFIILNLGLATFNLIPVAPLDGFKIIGGLLNKTQAKSWYELEQYGVYFLLALLLPIFNGHSLVNSILLPIINFLYTLIV